MHIELIKAMMLLQIRAQLGPEGFALLFLPIHLQHSIRL